MKKEEIKQLFETTQSHHNHLMIQVSNLVQGGDFEAVSPHVSKTECPFGKWLYNEALTLKKFLPYNKVLQYHNEFHDSLLDMVIEIQKDTPNSIFNRKKIKQQQEHRVQFHFQQIQNASFELLKSLNDLENEVINFEVNSNTNLFSNYTVSEKVEDKKTKGKKKLTAVEREEINEDIKRIFGEI